VFSDFKINSINEKELEAFAVGEDARGFRLDKEIKAATYHGLKLTRSAGGWQAEVILDV
jgi:SHS2 domain-containing protein